MLCENIWGNLKDIDTTGKKIDYVEFEWDEAFKRIHKKVSRAGKEVGIRLDDSVLTKESAREIFSGRREMKFWRRKFCPVSH